MSEPGMTVPGDPPWLRRLGTCPSTNTWALEHLDALEPGTLVHAEHQTAGRGQQGRRWHAPAGTLTVSLILHLPLDRELSALGLVVGLGVCAAITAVAPAAAPALKWPNDIYLVDRKLAGVLCEAVPAAGRLRVVAGLGLNLHTDFTAAGLGSADFPDLRQLPISLHECQAVLPPPLVIMSTLRACITAVVTDLVDSGPAVVAEAWRQRDWLRGRSVCVRHPATPPIRGQAAGINERGALLVRQADDTMIACMAGHVELL
jgi:BirA family biotin operon repressor/biotin-[acetyl-CoA-carboxylase] ligase